MILSELFGEDEEDEAQFKDRIKEYVEGEGPSLYVQAMKQSKDDHDALKTYVEEGDPDEDPPKKIKGIPMLFVLEKMMHQTDMLDERSFPTMTRDVDAYAKRYTIQDLILVMTLMFASLIDKKSLLLPSVPKQSRAAEGGDIKKKRDEINKVRLEDANKYRHEASNKLATLGYLKSVKDIIEDRILDDYAVFYTKLSKKIKEDSSNSELMCIFTKARVECFKGWESIGGGKKVGIKRVLTEKEMDSKEKKRLRYEAVSKGNIDLTIDETEDNSDDDWLA